MRRKTTIALNRSAVGSAWHCASIGHRLDIAVGYEHPDGGVWGMSTAVVAAERRACQFDLRFALFLELLHSMLLVVGDSPCKRHRTRHANMSEGDKECLFFVQRNDVAHDTAFITSIRCSCTKRLTAGW